MISTSLKQRFLLIVLPILLISIGVLHYSQQLVNSETAASIEKIGNHNQLTLEIRNIKESVQSLELLIHQYTFISSFDKQAMHSEIGEEYAKLNELTKELKTNLQVQQSKYRLKEEYLPVIASLNKILGDIGTQIDGLKEQQDDYVILLYKFQPAFNSANAIIKEIENKQQKYVEMALRQSNDAAFQISLMIWVSLAIILLIIVVGYFMFEHLVYRPVAQVANALNAEASGEPFIPIIDTKSTETQLLIDAFNNMREQVRSRQVRLESILDHAAEGIITYDQNCIIESFNHAAERVFGYSEQEAVAQKLDILFAKYIPGVDTENLNQILTSQGSEALSESVIEVAAKHKDGSVFPLSIKISNYEIAGKIVFTAIVEDVSERKAMIENLRLMAEHDGLTGLYNRHYFIQDLDHLVERVERQSESNSAVLYLDLDNFKYVNDTLGHKAGDELLVQITCILQKRNRRSDLLARIGGDEFAMILYDVTEDVATNVADIFRQNIHDYKFIYQGEVVDVGCSIGAVMVKPGVSREELLARADYSCHAAKLAGKNKIHLYTNDDQKDIIELSDDIGWTRRIKQALEDDMFVMACQPIKNPGGETKHYEVLLRMLDKDGNIIMPSGFIPPAERFGLMPNIDKWVIRHVILLLKYAPHYTPNFCLNLSATSFKDESIIDFITAHIEASKIEPNRLTFEITETAAMADLSMTATFLRKLQQLGCQTALDDFGAGYSSYAYLKDLPVDYVKIDGSFITDLENNSLNREIVHSMHNIARIMGKQTIAEFVESAEAAKILEEMGIDFLQGYYIGKPEIMSLDPDQEFIAENQ